MARCNSHEYGMSEKLGPAQYRRVIMLCLVQSPQKSISEQTAYEIIEEVHSLLNEAQTKLAESINQIIRNPQTDYRSIVSETLDITQIKSLYRDRKNA